MSEEAPHVQVVCEQQPLPDLLATALDRLGARITLAHPDQIFDQPHSLDADARIVVAPMGLQTDGIATLLRFTNDRSRCTLVLSPDGLMRWQAAPTEVVPTHGQWRNGLSADELCGHIRAMCEARRPLAAMSQELAWMQEVDAARPIAQPAPDDQLLLASQVQRDLLPNPMPESPTAKFHALYLPADHVSGDIYDVVRLDESHLAISLADASGHGMPAALLTVFIKRFFRGKAIADNDYRILEPNEVLATINRELLDTNLPHCQFVTAAHAIYDEQERAIRWARGGIPYPILVRRGCKPEFVRSTGILLGTIAKPPLDVISEKLSPGDRLYFYTDGLEALLCNRRAGENPFDLSYTPWFGALADRGPEDVLAEIARTRATIAADTWPCDDITVVCVECTQ
ncbi:MAG: SpoIIE family protein phosphatase [Phycisphaerae bacterium]|nr:SpoIIE family protein phosphatase [Phycisphaerae bacterium]